MSSFPPSSWSRPPIPDHRPNRSVPAASPAHPPAGGPPDECPLLHGVAELVHHGASSSPAPMLVGAVPLGRQVRLVAWELPAASDPLDPLIGWLAPDDWEVIGLTARSHPPRRGLDLDDLDDLECLEYLDDDHDDEAFPGSTGFDDRAGRATLAVDRSGRTRLVVAGPTGATVCVDDAAGAVSDFLLRALGRPTPPPEITTGTWVELRWLDRIAAIVLDRPGRASWDEVATCHPLHDDRRPAEPTTLALATLAHEATTTWASLRSGWPDAPTDGHPPGIGRATSLTDWFDDGSYARWVQRDLPPSDLLVEAVLATLPEAVAAELVQALVTT